MFYDEFNRSRVMTNVNKINQDIDEEKNKPINEQNKEKLLKLYQKQLMEGIKLCTGSRLF